VKYSYYDSGELVAYRSHSNIFWREPIDVDEEVDISWDDTPIILRERYYRTRGYPVETKSGSILRNPNRERELDQSDLPDDTTSVRMRNWEDNPGKP